MTPTPAERRDTSADVQQAAPAVRQAAEGSPEALDQAQKRTGERLDQAAEADSKNRQIMEEFKSRLAASKAVKEDAKGLISAAVDTMLQSGNDMPTGPGQMMKALKEANPAITPSMAASAMGEYSKAFAKFNAPIWGVEMDLGSAVRDAAKKFGMEPGGLEQMFREAGGTPEEAGEAVRITSDLASGKKTFATLTDAENTLLQEKFPQVRQALFERSDSDTAKESRETGARERAAKTIADSVESHQALTAGFRTAAKGDLAILTKSLPNADAIQKMTTEELGKYGQQLSVMQREAFDVLMKARSGTRVDMVNKELSAAPWMKTFANNYSAVLEGKALPDNIVSDMKTRQEAVDAGKQRDTMILEVVKSMVPGGNIARDGLTMEALAADGINVLSIAAMVASGGIASGAILGGRVALVGNALKAAKVAVAADGIVTASAAAEAGVRIAEAAKNGQPVSPMDIATLIMGAVGGAAAAGAMRPARAAESGAAHAAAEAKPHAPGEGAAGGKRPEQPAEAGKPAPEGWKPSGPESGNKLPDHMANLSADDLESVRRAESVLGNLNGPEHADTVAAIVKAHRHGEGKLYERAAVERMDMTELKEAFGRRYPGLEWKELRDRVLAAKDGANGHIGSYTDAELRQKIRIVQQEGKLSAEQGMGLVQAEALGVAAPARKMEAHGIVLPDGRVDWKALESIQFWPGDTAAGRLKFIREKMMGQVAENPFSAEGTLARIQRDLGEIMARLPANDNTAVLKIVRDQAADLVSQMKRNGLPERQVSETQLKLGKLTQDAENAVSIASKREWLFSALESGKVRPDIVNEMKTLQIRSGSADELMKSMKAADATAAKWKTGMPTELHAQVDEYVNAMIRESTDRMLTSLHRLPDNIDDVLLEAWKHGYSLSPETVARSQFTPDGKRALSEGRTGLEAVQSTLSEVRKMADRVSELRTEIASAREAALKAADRVEAAEPLARLESGVRELSSIAADLKKKIGNPADKGKNAFDAQAKEALTGLYGKFGGKDPAETVVRQMTADVSSVKSKVAAKPAKPVEAKPVETKPVESKPVEPEKPPMSAEELVAKEAYRLKTTLSRPAEGNHRTAVESMDILESFHGRENFVSMEDLRAMGWADFLKAMEKQGVDAATLGKLEKALSDGRADRVAFNEAEARQFWTGTRQTVRWLYNL